jgi:hypothetical protein
MIRSLECNKRRESMQNMKNKTESFAAEDHSQRHRQISTL